MPFYFTHYVKIPNVGTNLDALSAQLSKCAGQKNTFVAESIDHTPTGWVGQRYTQVVDVNALANPYPSPAEVEAMYSTFRIPKRSGGYREIKAPNDILKAQQRAIVKHFKKNLLCLEHNCAYGFVEHRNCKAALKVHQANESRWFLKVDFENFFPSFTYDTLMLQLSTIPNVWQNMVRFQMNGTNAISLMMHLCVDGDCRLVQGAPSSPYLANLAMIPFDYAFEQACKAKGLVYTRYADDLLISSKYTFDWTEVVRTIEALLQELRYPDLHIARHKTRYGSSNGANWNLGMMYNKDLDITVGHRQKHKMKVIAHKWDSLTQEEQVHWKGILSYYRSVEPDYFTQDRFSHMN